MLKVSQSGANETLVKGGVSVKVSHSHNCGASVIGLPEYGVSRESQGVASFKGNSGL